MVRSKRKSHQPSGGRLQGQRKMVRMVCLQAKAENMLHSRNVSEAILDSTSDSHDDTETARLSGGFSILSTAGHHMTPTARDYVIGAYCEAAVNQIDHRIMWAAIEHATTSHLTDCKALDANVQAAIRAGEWLNQIQKR